MSQEVNKQPAETQRAYTLRLQGRKDGDPAWRNALWHTHQAVNNGTKTFGDWILTLRGGLDHTLAEAILKDGKELSAELRRARRIKLALSWLSVESKLGAPAEDFIIADGNESAEGRNKKVIGAFDEILTKRNLSKQEIDEWKRDCSASLTAAIRDDAVWVNGSKLFDEAVQVIGSSLGRHEVWDMLERFLGSSDAYLNPTMNSQEDANEVAQENKAKDLVQKAGEWLSNRFGTGRGANFERMANVYDKIANCSIVISPEIGGGDVITAILNTVSNFNPSSNDLYGILGLISGPGYKSATRNLLQKLSIKTAISKEDIDELREKARADFQKCTENTGSKGPRPYSNAILKDIESACGFTYLQEGGAARHSEFAVMLDHAARRVSLAHTWINLAEAERRRFVDNARKIDSVSVGAKAWLESFCRDRTETSGALEPYRIRLRAIGGWKEVVNSWSQGSCSTATDRIAAARALQDDPEIDKFGDIQLFEALAQNDALVVWQTDGEVGKVVDSQQLVDYVTATEAEFRMRHFKVPAYRHPDALLHPVFCDFGNSRWDIQFGIHKQTQQKENKELSLGLLVGDEIKLLPMRWQAKRFARDLALRNSSDSNVISTVTRATRLGRAAANVQVNDGVEIS